MSSRTFKDIVVKRLPKNEQYASSFPPLPGPQQPSVIHIRDLPIYKSLASVFENVDTHLVTSVQSATGDGKTNAIPQYFITNNPGQKILIGIPTKTGVLSAYNFQKKQCEQYKIESCSVGYSCGGEVKYTDTDNIVYCTAGHLENVMLRIVQKILRNPVASSSVTWPANILVLDEFDIGSANSDICFLLYILYVKEWQKNKALPAPPKLILTSATMNERASSLLERAGIDFAKLGPFGDGASRFKIERRFEDFDSFPFFSSKDHFSLVAQRALEYHNKGVEGTYLIFVPGKAEMETVCSILAYLFKPSNIKNGESKLVLVQAHGEMDSEDLEKIHTTEVERGQRKIVVATNVAERSITIEGVSVVLDTMLHKTSKVLQDESTQLEVALISKASSTQRQGRTGRTCNGIYHALCSQQSHNLLEPFDDPELKRGDMSYHLLKIIDAKLNPLALFEPLRMGTKIVRTMKVMIELGFLHADDDVMQTLEGKWWWRNNGIVTKRTSTLYFGSCEVENVDQDDFVEDDSDDDIDRYDEIESDSDEDTQRSSPLPSSSSTGMATRPIDTIDINLDGFRLTKMGDFCSCFPLDIRKSSMLWHLKELQHKERLDVGLMRILVALICTIHGFGRGIYYWPKRGKKESLGDHNMRLNQARSSFAESFGGFSDVETLINVWCAIMSEQEIGSRSLSSFCKKNHLNLKKMEDVMSSFRLCCRIFGRLCKLDLSNHRPINTSIEDKMRMSRVMWSLCSLTHANRGLKARFVWKRRREVHLKWSDTSKVDSPSSLFSTNSPFDGLIDLHSYTSGTSESKIVLDKFGIRSVDLDKHISLGLEVSKEHASESPLYTIIQEDAACAFALSCLKVKKLSIVTLSHFNPELLSSYAQEKLAHEERLRIQKERMEREHAETMERIRLNRLEREESESRRQAEDLRDQLTRGAFNQVRVSAFSGIGVASFSRAFDHYEPDAPSASDCITWISKKKKKNGKK